MIRSATVLLGRLMVVAALVLIAASVASSAEETGDDHIPVDESVSDQESAPAPDPYSLAPLESSASWLAKARGERAATEIRGRVRALADARKEVARTGSASASRVLTDASEALVANAALVRSAGEEIDEAQFAHRELVEDHREAARVLEQRLAVLYAAGPIRAVDDLIDGYDPVSSRAKQILLDAVLAADQDRLVDTYLAATSDPVDVASLAGDLAVDRAERQRIIDELVATTSQAELAAIELAEAEKLSDDLAFPVTGAYSFVDTFLASRMAGTSDVHRHQGIDIFAPLGTPLVAIERGVVVKIGTVRLGGLRLWLIGESGARYYYAHMSAFADLSEGQFVEPGTVVGYVGTSGNARGTSPHVHFQVHPDGGVAVNGYPLLDQLRDRDEGLTSTGAPRYALCPRPDDVVLQECGADSSP